MMRIDGLDSDVEIPHLDEEALTDSPQDTDSGHSEDYSLCEELWAWISELLIKHNVLDALLKIL